jgi:tetratricopeptide (TPR) repeat protein
MAPGTLVEFNQVAVRQARAGDHAAAVATLTALLTRATAGHLTHPDLHTAYSNRSASHLELGDAAAALADADSCLGLLREWGVACGAAAAAHPSYPKAALRRGRALAALGRHTDAAAAFEAGLAADPASAGLAEALAAAARAAAAAADGSCCPTGSGGAAGALLGEGGLRDAVRAPLLPIAYAPRDVPLALLQPPSGAGGLGGVPPRGGGDPDSLAARRRARVEGSALPGVLLSAARAAEDRTLGEVYQYARVQVMHAWHGHVRWP